MAKPNKLQLQLKGFDSIEPIELNDAASYHNLRARCYRLLQDITLLSLSVASAIETTRNVTDVDTYLKRKKHTLEALKVAINSIDKVLNHSKDDARLAEQLDAIEIKLNRLKNEKKKNKNHPYSGSLDKE